MSESLRDQLMKAGFKDSSPAPKRQKAQRKAPGGEHGQRRGKSANKRVAESTAGHASKKSNRPSTAEAESAAAAAKKKAVKEKIKILIETHRIKDHTGTVAYSYQLGTRVKQLFVTEECQKQLAAGTLLITRLNGNTYLLPPDIGEQVTALNPDWALIGPGMKKPGGEDTGADHSGEPADDEYAAYQVPDDLNW